MKKTFIVAFLIYSVAMMNLAHAVQGEPDGFGGIKWGAEMKPPLDLSPLPGAKDGESFYEKKGEPLNMGKAGIESIKYGFYKNKFFEVIIQYKSASNFKKLKEMLEEEFGSGKRPNILFEQYFWDWPNVNVDLYYNPNRDEGRIIYYYKPIEKQKTADKKDEENKKKAKRHMD